MRYISFYLLFIKGNEILYKFNAKLQGSLDYVKSHLESNAVEKANVSLAEGT